MPLRLAVLICLAIVAIPEAALWFGLRAVGVSEFATYVLAWGVAVPLIFVGIFVVAGAHDWWIARR